MLVTFRGQKVKACGKKEAIKTIFEDNWETGAWK